MRETLNFMSLTDSKLMVCIYPSGYSPPSSKVKQTAHLPWNPFRSPAHGEKRWHASIYHSLYFISIMTTTIAVKESTRDKLRRIMKEEGAHSLDQAINSLMEKAERVPK